jgi:hypothetical protein
MGGAHQDQSQNGSLA